MSLSLRAICPDRAQTRDLPAHPLWGVRDARAVRMWGLRSGVTTCTANQWAAEASKSIGLGGWQAIFVKLQPCDGVPNPASHVRLRRTPFEHARKEKVDLTRGASSQHDPQLFTGGGRTKLPGRQEPQLSWERRRFFSRRT